MDKDKAATPLTEFTTAVGYYEIEEAKVALSRRPSFLQRFIAHWFLDFKWHDLDSED